MKVFKKKLNHGEGQCKKVNTRKWDQSLTRFTASSQAFFSSVALALFTLTTSLLAEGMATDKGPTGRSDSGDGGDRVRLVLGLGVRALFAAEAEGSETFFVRAMVLCC